MENDYSKLIADGLKHNKITYSHELILGDHHQNPIMRIIFHAIDIFVFFVKDLLPRLIVALIFMLICRAIIEETGLPALYLYFLLSAAFLFYLFPFTVKTYYLIEKNKKDDNRFFVEILKKTKDKSRGVYNHGNSLAIKSYFKSRIIRFINKFFEYHEPKNFVIIFHSKPKREYQDHYYFLVDLEYQKFIK